MRELHGSYNPCDRCDHVSKKHASLANHHLHCHQLGRFACATDRCSFIGETRREMSIHYRRAHSKKSTHNDSSNEEEKKPPRTPSVPSTPKKPKNTSNSLQLPSGETIQLTNSKIHRILSLRCFISDRCRTTLWTNNGGLFRHLERKHKLKRFICFVSGCEASFDER